MSLALIAGCSLLASSDPEPAPAEETADSLARALSNHSLDGVALTDPRARDRFTALVDPLSSYPVAVTVGDVRHDGDEATAILRWTWRLEEHRWAYETTAHLTTDAAAGSDEVSAGGWVVDWRPDALAPALTADEVIQVVRVPAPRADVLGAGGVRLVTDRPVVRYGLDKSQVGGVQVVASAARIARALDIDEASFRRAVQASGSDAFVEGLVLRAEVAASLVGPDFADVPGALAIDDDLPLAPTSEFAGPLLGRVGPATAEIIADSDGRIHEGDQVGLSGLQARYDQQLSGTPGIEVRAGAVHSCATWPDCPRTSDPRTLASWKPQRGTPLRTTIDEAVQLRAEQVLTTAGQRAGDGGIGSASALVAIRPSTGEILAAANGPDNDGLNAATYGRYAPGSTFKVVTALALLRAGLDPAVGVACPATMTVDGKQFKNYDDYPGDRLGTISFTTAIANSCNTALIGQRERLAAHDLSDAAAALGLGVDHDLGFPAYFGQAPPPAGETERAAQLIGQGRILASPLTMATVAASVVAGRVVVPHLLVPDDDHPLPAADPATPLTTAESQALRSLMRAVVTEGSGDFLGGLPGEIGAKTGTAEYGEPRPDGSLATHAWMIATQDDLAVAVFVETGSSGSQTAGPILEDFLR